MVKLKDVVNFCDSRTFHKKIKDYDGAYNGLQLENNGIVSKVAAAVDAGQLPFESAASAGADFIITHHGLFWNQPIPLTGTNYKKVKYALDNNIAVYGSHLPLDCHTQIGNNALLAESIGLKKICTFLPYEGTDIGIIAEGPSGGREEIASRLKLQFPKTYQSIEYGSSSPKRVAILTGSGQSALTNLLSNKVDTLITGELRQHHFNMAQELQLNLYPCGHYATEVFGVQALAKEVANEFSIEWTFIEQPCRL